jgi:hypothetical protein
MRKVAKPRRPLISESRADPATPTSGESQLSSKSIIRATTLMVALLSVMASYCSMAFASGPPIVETGGASKWGLNSVTVVGSVNANGGTGTTYKIEYGKTTAYGLSTPAQTLTGSGTVPISVQLVGLEPQTQYHWRVSATNNLGTTVGTDGFGTGETSWYVNGTRLAELTYPATFQTIAQEGELELARTTLAGNKEIVHCELSTKVSGTLGVEYNGLDFRDYCNATFNGKNEPGCRPIGGMQLHLNGLFALSETAVVKFPEECLFGTKLTLASGGYGAAEVAETEIPSVNLEGSMYTGDNLLWTTSMRLGGLKLTGAYGFKAFGIHK